MLPVILCIILASAEWKSCDPSKVPRIKRIYDDFLESQGCEYDIYSKILMHKQYSLNINLVNQLMENPDAEIDISQLFKDGAGNFVLESNDDFVNFVRVYKWFIKSEGMRAKSVELVEMLFRKKFVLNEAEMRQKNEIDWVYRCMYGLMHAAAKLPLKFELFTEKATPDVAQRLYSYQEQMHEFTRRQFGQYVQKKGGILVNGSLIVDETLELIILEEQRREVQTDAELQVYIDLITDTLKIVPEMILLQIRNSFSDWFKRIFTLQECIAMISHSGIKVHVHFADSEIFTIVDGTLAMNLSGSASDVLMEILAEFRSWFENRLELMETKGFLHKMKISPVYTRSKDEEILRVARQGEIRDRIVAFVMLSDDKIESIGSEAEISIPEDERNEDKTAQKKRLKKKKFGHKPVQRIPEQETTLKEKMSEPNPPVEFVSHDDIDDFELVQKGYDTREFTTEELRNMPVIKSKPYWHSWDRWEKRIVGTEYEKSVEEDLVKTGDWRKSEKDPRRWEVWNHNHLFVVQPVNLRRQWYLHPVTHILRN